METYAYGGPTLPPDSTVAAKDEFIEQYGKALLTVQYYSRIFGLKEVFLMDSDNKQKAWLSQKEVREQFNIVKLANNPDYFQDRVTAEDRYWKSNGSRALLK